jgi:hypothetical protein
MWSRFAHPSPALVVATIALIVALGGTSYAALSNNSVGSKQLENGAVGTAKLKNGAVGTGKLQNRAVTTAKLKNRAVTALKLNLTGVTVPNALHANAADSATNAANATNATNAANATNATNATTAGSANALNGVVIVHSPTLPNRHSSQDGQDVDCPSGMHAISGGVVDSGGTEQSVNDWGIENSTIPPTPTTTNNEVFANVNNTSTATDDTFSVWAVCINGAVTGSTFPPPS